MRSLRPAAAAQSTSTAAAVGSTSVAELCAASVGLAGKGTLPECLPEKLPNCSAARFFQSESLGPPEPRPSNILPSTTPKVSEKQVCPHAPVVGPSNGTCGGYATRRNQENHHWLGHPRWATLRLATPVSPPANPLFSLGCLGPYLALLAAVPLTRTDGAGTWHGARRCAA